VIFDQLGSQLRAALGGVALRIDQFAQRPSPVWPPKPIVDVQISVEWLEPVEPFRLPLEAAGFLYRAASTERTKRYFREPPGQRRTHIHVRRAGSFSEQSPCCSVTSFGPIPQRSGLWPTQALLR
jgi:hypothetical protein